MATLTTEERNQIWRGLMRYWSGTNTAIPITKPELSDAITETDIWVDNNQASYNTALPDAARNNLSADAKTLLFAVVAIRRTGDVELLKKLLGSVD